jgi:hypothetical protein
VRDDGQDAGKLERLADVDFFDSRVGVRAANDFAVGQVRQRHVGCVDGLAGDLVGPVVADGTLAENRVVFLVEEEIFSGGHEFDSLFRSG